MPIDPNTGLDLNSIDTPNRPNAFVRFLKKLFALLITGAILTLTWMLLSERNARLFQLQRGDEKTLFVLQGRPLPTGFMRWHPDDQELAQTYAPFVLAEEVLSGVNWDAVYSNRDELDRMLFKLHGQSVEMLVGREDNNSVEQMVQLIQRASRLGGITETQKAKLKEMMAQSSFLEGRLRLVEAGEKLRLALSRLRSASENEQALYGEKADQLLAHIREPAQAILQVIQSPQLDGEKASQERSSTAIPPQKSAHIPVSEEEEAQPQATESASDKESAPPEASDPSSVSASEPSLSVNDRDPSIQ